MAIVRTFEVGAKVESFNAAVKKKSTNCEDEMTNIS